MPFVQLSSSPPASTTWSTGRPHASKGVFAPLRPRRRHREAGGVQDQVCLGPVQHALYEVRGDGILEARYVERKRIHAARAEGARERVDGREVGRLQVGAIEDDGGGGRAGKPFRGELFEPAHAHARTVDAGARQGGRLAPLARATDQVCGEGEQVARIGGARVHAVLPQAVGGLDRHASERHELGVGLVVAGKERERDRRGPAGFDELLDAVGPVAAAAEHARDDELRLRDHRLDVGVHRHRVGEVHEVRKPKRGKGVVEALPRRGEARELGVRGGKEDDVPGGLSEIDRLGLVDRRARLRLQQVHGFRRRRPDPAPARRSAGGRQGRRGVPAGQSTQTVRSASRMRASSSPASPITTSRERRASPSRHSRS